MTHLDHEPELYKGLEPPRRWFAVGHCLERVRITACHPG